MNVEEFATAALNEILAIGQEQTLPAATRIAHINSAALRFPSSLLAEVVASQTNFVVPYGPFLGLRCINASTGSTIVPRLLGSYEAELHDTIEKLAGRDYRRVVNIGCGEGYYAVGLARRLPSARVFALDT